VLEEEEKKRREKCEVIFISVMHLHPIHSINSLWRVSEIIKSRRRRRR
jgi:hypothetical protein